MPRCKEMRRELTDAEYREFFGVEWKGDRVNIPVEDKRESFGILDGQIVAIDYGD
jgi:hypothetical protein